VRLADAFAVISTAIAKAEPESIGNIYPAV
jgi:hypothetical protein